VTGLQGVDWLPPWEVAVKASFDAEFQATSIRKHPSTGIASHDKGQRRDVEVDRTIALGNVTCRCSYPASRPKARRIHSPPHEVAGNRDGLELTENA